MSGWRVYAAAVTGQSHLEQSLPCQDACAYVADGDALVAVVCDGAGSQAASHIGSELLSREVSAALLPVLDAALADEQAARASLEAAIGAALVRLGEQSAVTGLPLSAYACTLVGAMARGDRAWLFHVGDGVAVAVAADGGQTVSPPENGEYANETFFATSPQWREHLRLTPCPTAPVQLVLMSDGSMPFAMDRGNAGLFAGFMQPVVRHLAAADEQAGSAALRATLDDPRTHAITNDDKTLLIALRA